MIFGDVCIDCKGNAIVIDFYEVTNNITVHQTMTRVIMFAEVYNDKKEHEAINCTFNTTSNGLQDRIRNNATLCGYSKVIYVYVINSTTGVHNSTTPLQTDAKWSIAVESIDRFSKA
jgi:hypothetical protein